MKSQKKIGSEKFLKGFTLIEVLVYIAVLTIIVLAISSLLIWAIRSGAKAKAMRETLNNAERAMAIMVHETKEAKGIYTPTSLFDAHPGQLSLETTKYSSLEEETIFLDFYLCQDKLCLKKESQDPFVLTSDSVEISNLVFSEVFSGQAPSLQIDLIVSYKNPQNRPEYSASVNLRSTVSLIFY